MKTLAPIAIFTYNRPDHTLITLECFSKIKLANESVLYVFCDGPKDDARDSVRQKINDVKEVVKSKKWAKEVIVIESEFNKGLAQNVTKGISSVLKKHDKVIALEDDLLIGDNFLVYMNEALNKYEKNARVKQVSGFLFPFEIKPQNSSIFLPLTNTIGWGTWKRAWEEISLDATGWEKLSTDKKLRRAFNLNNSYDYSKMLESQMNNNNFGSWAIKYWWSVFKTDGVVLYPDYPMIQHNDFDNSGQHGSIDDHYVKEGWDVTYEITHFPDLIEVNYKALAALQKHLRKYSPYTLKNIFLQLKLRLLKKKSW